MTKKFPYTRIKTHRIYSIFEAADALGCHRQTVIRWIKNGLVANKAQKPWLIEGRVLREFLGERQAQAKQKLALDHFYCLGCKSPQAADGKIADYCHLSPTSGQLSALCPSCENIIYKIVKRDDLEAIRTKISVTIQQADPRLVSFSEPLLKVTSANREKAHAK